MENKVLREGKKYFHGSRINIYHSIMVCLFVPRVDSIIYLYFIINALIHDSLFPLSLADLVLSNKLVVYDLENMVIGWTDYNCEYDTILIIF